MTGHTDIVQQGSNVVSIFDFQPERVFPSTTEVEAYWHKIRGNRMLPSRSDVDPRGIENSLEYAFILERIAPGLARFRLTGSHLTDLMGMDVRGMPMTSLFMPEARKDMGQYIERLFDTPEIISLSLTAPDGFRRPALFANMVLLPLKSDLGDVSRALGCLVSHGTVGRTPRRFEISDAQCTALSDRPVQRSAPAVERPQVQKPVRPVSGPKLTLLSFDT
ncbi:PAS domain-containing protein [Pseudaestuariivita rosea]|uniref:PAS domain-containing protein n=1 Tax=Pseudaestuariivita rosea TaxID=2763263 RepID=UPI001ABA8B70|nr:PAS domain-containing protein [Pseudaestuariivita rosea]